MRRGFRTEQMANYRSQQFAKRFYAIGYLSAIVGGVLVFLYIKFFERDELMGLNREVKTTGVGFQMYTDPNMYGNEARLFLGKGYWLPEYMFTSGNVTKLEKFVCMEDDIVVASFPKSGSTWVQEVVYLLNNNMDEKKARKQNMEDRFPQLEYTYPGLAALEAAEGPRLLKTHLPFEMLPKSIKEEGKTKLIYIMRNPKDVCVSSYFYSRMHLFLNYQSDLAHYCSSFLTGRVSFGPWWDHMKSYYAHRDDPNVLVITYEDMQQDTNKTIQAIASFLGKELSTKQVTRIAKYCSFDEMKKNPASNYSWWDKLGIRQPDESEFLRSGKVGKWAEHLTSEQSAYIDKICQMYLTSAGIEPQFELGGKKDQKQAPKQEPQPVGQK
ncbi:Sulfotransferase family cytosolic 1B member 1 [Lamellibrachia satsuma]|nr:Sulfotransferase family cytosolic 1B member 1 [Lamellibrachia satsuma]